MTQQTEAQRLAALIGRFRSPYCGEAAVLLRRQDELLKQALEALEAALSDDKPYIVQSKKAITAIRAHLEAK